MIKTKFLYTNKLSLLFTNHLSQEDLFMSHGCFISYKKEDKQKGYLKKIVDKLNELDIPNSYLDRTIDSENIDTVISVLRQEYMNNKPVTLFLIGKNSYEDTKERWQKYYGSRPHPEYNEQSFIIRELRATLSDYDGNPRHGVVGIVLPEMEQSIYQGEIKCNHCGAIVSIVNANDDTVIREFWQNYYLVHDDNDCTHYSEDDRYCVLCRLDDFLSNPNRFIDLAYQKSQSKIAKEVRYRNIKHDYKLRDE